MALDPLYRGRPRSPDGPRSVAGDARIPLFGRKSGASGRRVGHALTRSWIAGIGAASPRSRTGPRAASSGRRHSARRLEMLIEELQDRAIPFDPVLLLGEAMPLVGED